jgi:lipopolysaccharide transport system ATP-binding protein
MSSDSVISVQDLGKRYEIFAQPHDRLRQMLMPPVRRAFGLPHKDYCKEFWALHDVSFAVNSGETVAIVGENGSGKSTLLQLVCGTLSPTTGRAQISGRIAALLELGAGFNTEFSGRENVFLSGLLYGISRQELSRRYDSIVAFAELEKFIDQPVKTYSSGMYVRLAFSVAAHVDADVLVVDEALSVGDVRFTQKCMRFLREFQKTGTLLFVSHDTSAVVSLCTRAIWLDHGRLRMDGPAKDVVESYLAAQHALDREGLGDVVALRMPQTPNASVPRGPATLDVEDARWAAMKAQNGLSQFTFFEFDPEQANTEFGAGGAQITQAEFVNEQGDPMTMGYGGDLVVLRIYALSHRALENVIFGFYFKDRMGQRLFGDNSFLTYQENPVSSVAGEQLVASFRFRMPILPVGQYSIDLAIASGSQHDHTQQHWVHDALEVRGTDSSMKHGLVGLPMLDIAVGKKDQ